MEPAKIFDYVHIVMKTPAAAAAAVASQTPGLSVFLGSQTPGFCDFLGHVLPIVLLD